jgi:dihydrofolate reductase
MTAQRKIVVAEFISLDGVVETPEQWHMSYVDEEMMAAVGAVQARIDTMLLGRVTYETFAGAFAGAPAEDPIVAQMNRLQKVVVSSTLSDPTWENSTVLAGDVVDGVRELKARPGADILVTGSITLVRGLLAAGLVDELNLLVHPLVVGAGERLFEAEGPKVPLTLTSSTVLGSGVTNACYAVA